MLQLAKHEQFNVINYTFGKSGKVSDARIYVDDEVFKSN